MTPTETRVSVAGFHGTLIAGIPAEADHPRRGFNCGLVVFADTRKRERCSACGFRIRGPGHQDGPHHNGNPNVGEQ